MNKQDVISNSRGNKILKKQTNEGTVKKNNLAYFENIISQSFQK